MEANFYPDDTFTFTISAEVQANREGTAHFVRVTGFGGIDPKKIAQEAMCVWLSSYSRTFTLVQQDQSDDNVVIFDVFMNE